MVARITRFYTRAELGMRAPKSVSYNIDPEDGGAAIHYGGGGPNPPPLTFAAAKRIWLGWQAFHMNGNGWVDIAYTAGFDNLGNVYAGRGLGVRTAANGSNLGNNGFHAFVWIGGGSAVPSAAALDAADWLIKYGRDKGKAGMAVKPHLKFTGTSCPGKIFVPYAASRDGKLITLPTSPSVPTVPLNPYLSANPAFPLAVGHWYGRDDGTPLSHSGARVADRDEIIKIQRVLNTYSKSRGWTTVLPLDGRFGPKTETICKSWQYATRAKHIDGIFNGKFGRNSWNVAF